MSGNSCIDRRFAKYIKDHIVRTVPEMGWAGLTNSELLRKAENQFDALITVDNNLSLQQNLTNFHIGVLVLRASTNRLEDLIPLRDRLLSALSKITPGKVLVICR